MSTWNFVLIATGTKTGSPEEGRDLAKATKIEDIWHFQELKDAMMALLSIELRSLDKEIPAFYSAAAKRYDTVKILDGHTQEQLATVIWITEQDTIAAGLPQGIYLHLTMELSDFESLCGIRLDREGMLFPGTTVLPLSRYVLTPTKSIHHAPEQEELLQQLYNILTPASLRWNYFLQVVEHQLPDQPDAPPISIATHRYHYLDIGMPLRTLLLADPSLMDRSIVEFDKTAARFIESAKVFNAEMDPQFSLVCNKAMVGGFLHFDVEIKSVGKEAFIDLSPLQEKVVSPAVYRIHDYDERTKTFSHMPGLGGLIHHLQLIATPSQVDRLYPKYILHMECCEHDTPLEAHVPIQNENMYVYDNLSQAIDVLLKIDESRFQSEQMKTSGQAQYLRRAMVVQSTNGQPVASRFFSTPSQPLLSARMVLELQVQRMSMESFRQIQQHVIAHQEKELPVTVVQPLRPATIRKKGRGNGR